MKIFAAILAVLVGLLSYDLINGRNGITQYRTVEAQVETARHKQTQLKQRNQAIQDEISDLQQGSLAVEELARSELGMIKPNETFYRVISKN
ncbi:MAG: cell division protein FtsB [Succinivibrio sp.]|nr:cell division protein FtsB [Succinivibrio sp.]